MDIIFKNDRLKKLCNNGAKLIKKFGSRKAKLIGLRLQQLRAVETLADTEKIPQMRCHALREDRAGQFAVDTDHPYRIVFEPANDPIPQLDDGGIDRSKVTAICILDVNVDYHD
jgi:proteic killer suppression protein